MPPDAPGAGARDARLRRRRRSQLEFDAYRAGVPELAWIVEDAAAAGRAVARAWRPRSSRRRACESLGVRRERARCCALRRRPARRGEADRRRRRRALVRARAGGHRGARKRLRPERGGGELPLREAARNVACQWFQRGAVLALLPLPGEQVSMVWSLPRCEAARVSRARRRSALPRGRGRLARRARRARAGHAAAQLSAAPACGAAPGRAARRARRRRRRT